MRLASSGTTPRPTCGDLDLASPPRPKAPAAHPPPRRPPSRRRRSRCRGLSFRPRVLTRRRGRCEPSVSKGRKRARELPNGSSAAAPASPARTRQRPLRQRGPPRSPRPGKGGTLQLRERLRALLPGRRGSGPLTPRRRGEGRRRPLVQRWERLAVWLRRGRRRGLRLARRTVGCPPQRGRERYGPRRRYRDGELGSEAWAGPRAAARASREPARAALPRRTLPGGLALPGPVRHRPGEPVDPLRLRPLGLAPGALCRGQVVGRRRQVLLDDPLEVELGDDSGRRQVVEVRRRRPPAPASACRRRGGAGRSPRRGSRPAARRAACSRSRRRVSSGGSCSSMRPHSSMRRMPSMRSPWVDSAIFSARSMVLELDARSCPRCAVEQPVEGGLAREPAELRVEDLAVAEVADRRAPFLSLDLDGARLAAHLEGLDEVHHAHVAESCRRSWPALSFFSSRSFSRFWRRIFTRVTISLM